jgi:hypothetical protein
MDARNHRPWVRTRNSYARTGQPQAMQIAFNRDDTNQWKSCEALSARVRDNGLTDVTLTETTFS